MSTKARYDAAREKYRNVWQLGVAEMEDIFEYVGELEAALHQEGHIVEFAEDGFAVQHPVGCRKDGLLNCPVWEALDDLPGTPIGYGRFPVDIDVAGELVFEIEDQPLSEETS